MLPTTKVCLHCTMAFGRWQHTTTSSHWYYRGQCGIWFVIVLLWMVQTMLVPMLTIIQALVAAESDQTVSVELWTIADLRICHWSLKLQWIVTVTTSISCIALWTRSCDSLDRYYFIFTHPFNSHFPGKPGLTSCTHDSQSPLILILSILVGRLKLAHNT